MPETRRDFLPSGVRLFLLVQGVATLVLLGVLIVFDEEIGLTTAGLILVGMLVFEAGLQYMHSHITPFQDSIRIGFWPMFRRTFRYRDLAGVEAVTVDAMRDYRGWGVKGRSRSEKGMLIGGGSPHGLAITTRDGRRYVVTSPEPVDDLVATIAVRVR